MEPPGGYFDPDTGPNPVLERIRAIDITPEGRAPFSDQPLLFLDDDADARLAGGKSLGVTDIPIENIVGISDFGNLHNYEPGMSFQQVLFNCLHGASLTDESLDYLCGDLVKSKQVAGFIEFPQLHGLPGALRARRGMSFTKVRDRYYADQGQQRAIFARYAIFQRFGISGLLRNVYVYSVG